MVHATVNGERIQIPPGTTIRTFILSKELSPPQIVIEYNGEIIPRESWDGIPVCDGDNLEIVKFLGGG